MKTLFFVLLFAGIASAQNYSRETISGTYTNPLSLIDSVGTYHLDIHNYGPGTLQVKTRVSHSRDSSYTVGDSTRTVPVYFYTDSLYPAIPSAWTVNYSFSIDSTHTLPLWKASSSATNVFYRVHK